MILYSSIESKKIKREEMGLNLPLVVLGVLSTALAVAVIGK